MTLIHVFPGQGSQKVGMGDGLFNQFSNIVAHVDNTLGYSIEELCLEDPQETLNQTEYTQPALYVVNNLTYLKKVQETTETPNYVAGHSLGEYSALFAAGAFDFITGLKLVQKRGELMSQATGGGMAAIVGLSESQIKSIIEENFDDIDLANLNAPKQYVISGPKESITASKPIFEKAECRRFIELSVSGAFHSRYMKKASEEFNDYLKTFSYNEPEIPVIANATAEPYSLTNMIENLTSQIYSSVLWTETIEKLNQEPDPSFEEIGPGKVLAGLIGQIKRAL